MEDIYTRTELLIGKHNLNIIKNLNICICGVGGVGSYVFESLVRAGVNNITIIDKDVVDVTNINRQLIALNNNIGKNKVDEAFKRGKLINDKCNINSICDCLNENNISKYISAKFDYVVDAIDDVNSKIALIEYCYNNKIKIISSMGMGNRLNPLDIRVSDIYKTSMCPLARKIRKALKEKHVNKLKVVYSIEEPIKKKSTTIASISFMPGSCGLVIASEVIKDCIKGCEICE